VKGLLALARWVGAFALAATAFAASAQDYPTRPIKILVDNPTRLYWAN